MNINCPNSAFIPHKNLNEHFTELTKEIVLELRTYGIERLPFQDHTLPHFSKLTNDKKLQALKSLQYQLEFFKAAKSEGSHPNCRQLLWRMLTKIGYVPQSDIFDKITDEDNVEIYNVLDSTSLFKNLKFFEFVSMTMEEIYTLPWTEQWLHSPKVKLMFLEIQARTKLSECRETFSPIINHYTVSEKVSEKRKLSINMKWISPLKYQGQPQALLTICRCQFA